MNHAVAICSFGTRSASPVWLIRCEKADIRAAVAIADWRLLSIGSSSVAPSLQPSRENRHIAVLEVPASRRPTAVSCQAPETKMPRTVVLDDKIIRCVNASLAAPAAVVEEAALKVAVPHLSSEGAQER